MAGATTDKHVFWDQHAEQAALGAAVANVPACGVVCRTLSPDDFYLERDRRIMAALVALHGEGREADVVTLAAKLRADPELQTYLHGLAESVPAVSNAAEYVAVVRDNARRRRLSQGTRIALEKLAQGNGEGERLYREAIAETLEREAEKPVRSLHVVTAPELAKMSAEQVSYVVRPYLARGNITQLAGIIKGGKTHLALDMVSALLGGREFAGHMTERCPVLFMTEQGLVSFRVALRRAGVIECPDLHVLMHASARSLDWPQTCEMVLAYIVEHAIGLVVVDTLSHWAALPRDAEKDEAAARYTVQAMRPWADVGCAVLALQHERKGGGAIGESARGSSAFGGAMDILLALRRDESERNQNRRRLAMVTRLDDEAQDVVIELVDGRYVMVGEVAETKRLQTQRDVLNVLPEGIAAAIDLGTIVELSGVARSTAQRILSDLRVRGVAQTAKVRRQDGHGMREVFFMGESE